MAGTIVFAGGGSGGHIYPALAIAEQVRRLAERGGESQPRLIFVCSDRAIDKAILDAAGVRFVVSPAKPVLLSARGVARFCMSWLPAVGHAQRLLADAARLGPVEVCAMGGFVAAPVVRAAGRKGVGVTMVNLDAVPGKANRWIGPRSRRVFTAARVQGMERGGGRGPAWEMIPPIVRAAAGGDGDEGKDDRGAIRRRLGIEPSRPVLMVTTGSQGLRSVNAFLAAFAVSEHGQKTLRDGGWHVLHQTGRNLDGPVREAYAAAGVEATVVPFTEQIADWWRSADAAVATAGAGNVAEAWCSRVPTLFMPYPYHKDEHQRYNALPLVEAGAAVLGTDRIDAAANVAENGAALAGLLGNANARAAMRRALEGLGPADGAARVARALLDGFATGETVVQQARPRASGRAGA